MEAIGHRLKELLKLANITQTNFAVKCKISRITINKIINGRMKKITFELLLLICDGLNISLQEFFQSKYFEEKIELPEKQKRRIVYR
jgi:transcriptional regulator with XRE-family HTH domain